MITSVEQICNLALAEIGYRERIADIYDGSEPSKLAIELYGQTRDEVLQSKPWPFALRETQLVDTGIAPPMPWVVEYVYPTDCLRIRAVRPGPLFVGQRSQDPQPVLFMPWNDNRSTPIRAILVDQANAILVYTGRIVDPTTWEPEFTKNLVARLMPKFASYLINPSQEQLQLLGTEAVNEDREASRVTDLLRPSLVAEEPPQARQR